MHTSKEFINEVNNLKMTYADNEPRSNAEAYHMAKNAADQYLKYITCFPIRMATVMHNLGFKVFTGTMKSNNMSGMIAINVNEKYNKLILVNKKNNYCNQYFTVAYEFAHYIFEASANEDEKYLSVYYDTSINNEKNLIEYRANKFAVELLMPEKPFKTIVNENSKYKEEEQLKCIAKAFSVSEKIVKRRIEELNIVIG